MVSTLCRYALMNILRTSDFNNLPLNFYLLAKYANLLEKKKQKSICSATLFVFKILRFAQKFKHLNKR